MDETDQLPLVPTHTGAEVLYSVVVRYREPTYEARAGTNLTSYHWTYAVRAQNVEEARDVAISNFRDVEKKSGVGWVREILEVVVSLG